MADALKPCPFCGDWWSDAAQSGPELRDAPNDSSKLFIRCSQCGAEGPWVSNCDEAAAIAAWNTRTPTATEGDEGLREAELAVLEWAKKWRAQLAALPRPSSEARQFADAVDAYTAALSRTPAKATTTTPTPEDEKP